MSAYASLFNIDQNIQERLIEFVGYATSDEQLDFAAETMRYVVEKDTFNFLKKIFERTEKIIDSNNDEDVESFVQASVSVLYTSRIEPENSTLVKDTIKIFLEAITANTTNSRLRLKALLCLLNIIFESDVKYDILLAILNFSNLTNTTKLISHFHSRVDEWISTWNLSVLQKRTLYQSFSEILAIENKTSLSLIYLIKYFDTFTDSKYPTDVEAIAITAVLSAIKSPVSSFTDRLALLESFRKQTISGDLGLLVELLNIVCTGKLKDFDQFESSNQSFLTKYSIDSSSIRYSIRLMSLCSLGCEKPNLSFKEIATALFVSEDDVENWIVDAVGQGLMQAQIDQMANTVCIARSAHRSFGPVQWSSLQEKLKGLRIKVASVLDAVKKHS